MTENLAKGVVPAAIPPPMSSDALHGVAFLMGLERMGVRPPFKSYIKSLWKKRHFASILATSRAYARNQTNYLGQLWTVLNPALNAITYVLVFGLLLKTTRGLENAIGFIIVGTFIYRFFQQSINAGARSITSNMNLVRSMHFPRAVLPISSVLAELTTTIPALIVMCGFTYLSGFIPGYGSVPITWWWLLMPVAVLLFWIFNTGCAFIMARWVSVTPDVVNVIPFALQLTLYASGVIFSIQHYFENNEILRIIFEYQPIAVYLQLVRSCILNEPSIQPSLLMWIMGVIWALLLGIVGFIIFWRGEERYGRD